MNIYLVIILAILLGEYVLDVIVGSLNTKAANPVLPEEFAGYYDADKYKQAQSYLKEQTRFEFFKNTVSLGIIAAFLLVGGFNFVDRFARSFTLGPIFTGLIFAATLIFAFQFLDIPFSVYHTFVLEEKYGFNKTSVKTFILDIVKVWILTTIIGGIVFSSVLWFFGATGNLAWIYSWVAVVLFQLFLAFIAPVLILPLFNKFTPLEEGELKTAIEQYASGENFKMRGVFKMDASRRSRKSNAFFTGFGKYRRIALFDTLVEKHSVEELVSVLAHEIGHYKKKHIVKGLILSVVTTGVMFFILSFLINNAVLFKAFRMEEISIYGSLFFFGFLYSPINLIFSVYNSFLSRRYEYEADAYAVSTYKKPEAFLTALKKLSVDSLSNLTPHPLKVFLHYSHPPVLKRIEAIRNGI